MHARYVRKRARPKHLRRYFRLRSQHTSVNLRQHTGTLWSLGNVQIADPQQRYALGRLGRKENDARGMGMIFVEAVENVICDVRFVDRKIVAS